MNTRFSFSILRYIHDVISGEFVNIGVVVYAPDREYLECKINTKYSRVSSSFYGFDSAAYRSYTAKLQDRINRHGAELETGWLFPQDKLDELLRHYLPVDDSAYQFGPIRCGITDDPSEELHSQFDRFVTRYVKPDNPESRNDEAVWTAFKHSFPDKGLLTRLKTFTVVAPLEEHVFEHAWKNERWHFAEPISLDLQDTNSILGKAERWLGRLNVLKEAEDVKFKVHFLVGLPASPELLEHAKRAEQILQRAGDTVEIVSENDTARLVNEIRNDLAEEHNDSTQS